MSTFTGPEIKESRPIFVMGLPRSGSTLLSRLLNETDDILSVNDLYYLQAVLAERASEGTLSYEQVARLLETILEVISTRAQAEEEFIGQFSVSPSEINEIRQAVLGRAEATAMTWADVMHETLTAVSEYAGKKRWADKTPQNFYHFELLEEFFPSARFVFLFRDPRNILSSFKYATGEGHDSRRYHPVAYALYWRSAVRYYIRLKKKPNVEMVRYEDILDSPKKVSDRLSDFLHTSLRNIDISTLGHNSSFKKGGRRKITGLEEYLCGKLCSSEMSLLGYEPRRVKLSPSDFIDFLRVTCVFAFFQASRFVTSKDSRGRIAAFLRGLVVR
jgi:hypothetical protein